MIELGPRSTGYVPPPLKERNFYTGPELSLEEVQALPSDVDWTKKTKGGAMLKSVNQGSCGSCYAFASVWAYSYRQFIESNGRYNVVISPQSAMSCTNGCHGGNAQGVFKAMANK